MKKNQMEEVIKEIIRNAINLVKNSPKSELIQETAKKIVEGFYYSNLILNFRNNIIENKDKLKLTESEFNKFNEQFNQLYKKCEITLKTGVNNSNIDSNTYSHFKSVISKNKPLNDLLNDIESEMLYDIFKKKFSEFNEDIKKMGRKIKVTKSNTSVSVSF